MSLFKEWYGEAREAFYNWEIENLDEAEKLMLSDRDIEIWCIGYVEAKLNQAATDKLNEDKRVRAEEVLKVNGPTKQ